MAQKIEKLEQGTLDKIVKYQSDANQIIFELGQLSLQIREFESQLKKANEIKTQSEEKFDNIEENNYDIPKTIYLCYKHKQIPDYIIPTWQKLNPNYKIILYDIL